MSTLRLTFSASQILIALLTAGLAGCASPREPTPAHTQPLTETRWVLTEVLGRQVETPADGRLPDLRFDQADARVGGYTGCNVLTGPYSLNGDRLEFPTPLATTRRACVDTAIARQETDLLEAIERTRRFSLVGDILTFYDDVRAVARFTPGSALEPGSGAP
ncbi:MAG: META domain-containing protein [Gemmatimonadetes bacterium]|nr:META domain-containing protein [Gemmatimonadota bacterium]